MQERENQIIGVVFMDKTQIQIICEHRLDSWSDILVENHATPLLLIGVGHDDHSGEMHIIVPDDKLISNEMIVAILHKALQLKISNFVP